MKDTSFTFNRQRGVVWVCDIERSSRLLNDNESVEAIEEYLPRLHWLAKVSASAADGNFVKWTGDGCGRPGDRCTRVSLSRRRGGDCRQDGGPGTQLSRRLRPAAHSAVRARRANRSSDGLPAFAILERASPFGFRSHQMLSVLLRSRHGFRTVPGDVRELLDLGKLVSIAVRQAGGPVFGSN